MKAGQDRMCAGSVSTISPDEPVIRRIPKSPGFYDSHKTPPILRGAFTPNQRDTDGLSFFLERELPIEALLANSRHTAEECLIVRLKASDIYDLGMTLARTNKTGDLPGHVVVPELNIRDYEKKQLKQRLKECGKRLADLAWKNVVILPNQISDDV